MGPFNIVRLCNTSEELQPHYQILGRKYFSMTLMPQMFEKCKETVQRIIQLQDSVALTTNIWSSCGHDSVISFTTHFMAEEGFSRKHCLLQASTYT